MTDIHLFIDDERDQPPQFSHLVRTPAEAIQFLEVHRADVVTISFDHDLGFDLDNMQELTSMPIMHWMAGQNWWPEQLFVHSANPFGARRLLNFAQDHAPEEFSSGYQIVNASVYWQ